MQLEQLECAFSVKQKRDIRMESFSYLMAVGLIGRGLGRVVSTFSVFGGGNRERLLQIMLCCFLLVVLFFS